MLSDPAPAFRFGEYVLDVAAYELRRNGRPVRLEQQPLDLLILLVERRQQLVTREDIGERLWGRDVFVDVDNGIHTAIRKIRQALRDSSSSPAFIETVPGKGYRFAASVETIPRASETSVPQTGAPTPEVSIADVTAGTDLPQVSAVPGAATSVPPHRMPIARPRMSGLLLATVATLVLVGVGFAWMSRGRVGGGPVTLAVLPFEHLGGEPDRQYLADGLVEETIASLGQLDPERLSVIGRTSVMTYKGTTTSIAEIGRELGADYVVESSIRTERDRLRVTSKLIRVRDQVQVWSASYDRELRSALTVQRELSTAIAEQIRSRLSPERLGALATRQTANAEAYDLYLRGINFSHQRTPATTRRAVEYFTRATTLDPGYALAWSGISQVYAASMLNGDAAPSDVAPRAREAAARAIAADPNLAQAQFAHAYVKWVLDWDWPGAETAFRRAITLDPSYVDAHRALGHALSQMGRTEDANASMRRARELDPLHAMNHALSAQVAFQGRDYSTALDLARRAIALDPEFWIGHMQAAQSYERIGEHDLALDALTPAARFSGMNSKTLSLRGYILAKVGRRDDARAVLKMLEDTSRDRYVPPYAAALVHGGLGDRDAAFAALERAYRVRDVHLMYLPVDAKWDPYRADPRFQALIARCGF